MQNMVHCDKPNKTNVKPKNPHQANLSKDHCLQDQQNQCQMRESNLEPLAHKNPLKVKM